MTHHGELTDRVAIVTGAAHGIGRATAEVMRREGARVALLDRDRAEGEKVAHLLGAETGSALFVQVDLCDESDVQRAFIAVAAWADGIDILVNNAGVNAHWSAVDMSTSDWDAFMAIDLRAAWLCARSVIPMMARSRGAAIVNVASVHAEMTAEGTFPYGVAKAGILGLTRSLALDHGPQGIRVNAVSPGYTRTALVDAYLHDAPAGEAERIDSVHALRRIADPREVAEVISFLASDRTSFVTGANWVVDGGISARFA